MKPSSLPRREQGERESRWFWATLALSSISLVAGVFAAWELIESRFFRDADYVTLHALYITRGMASSLLLAAWAAWYVLKQRRRSEEELRRSREHYRRLLETSPGAVALYDAGLLVSEWNAAAERLYGFAKDEVLDRPVPTVPSEKEDEHRALLARARGGEAVREVETLRRARDGRVFPVELGLLPFRDASGELLFLETTSDISERVRLRQTLLEVEKLTSMGRMAAGTAHHLNTPLAALLLRVQMMRDGERSEADLPHLERGLVFCLQFVQRLLEFSRRPAAEKRVEGLEGALDSVLSFLAPTFLGKGLRVARERGEPLSVLADRNLMEALFSILLSNAADAAPEGGEITVACRRLAGGRVEVRITDDGPGIAPADLAHLFEPFFSTKGPGKGTGLGLAIARGIVTEHGGTIRLESAPGRGTAAVVELPLHGERRTEEAA